MLEKQADYERMGISGIWVIDPKKTVAYGYNREGLNWWRILVFPA
jgi:Uma2 family endonuclease